MRFLVLAAMAGAWALAGWRNMPRLDDPSSAAAGAAVAGCLVIAYLVGKRTTRASAIAAAVAAAEATAASAAMSQATSTAQVLVQLDPRFGARAAGAGMVGGLDQAEWIAGPRQALDEMPEDVVEMAAEEMGELQHERL